MEYKELLKTQTQLFKNQVEENMVNKDKKVKVEDIEN